MGVKRFFGHWSKAPATSCPRDHLHHKKHVLWTWYPGSPWYTGTLAPWFPVVPWDLGTREDATWRPLVRGESKPTCKVSHHTGPHKTNKTHTRTIQGEQPTTRHPEDLNPLPDMVRFSLFENLLRQVDFWGKCCTSVCLYGAPWCAGAKASRPARSVTTQGHTRQTGRAHAQCKANKQ